MPENNERDYLIWSWKHSQWWGPDRSGYTSDLAQAGCYTSEEAGEIVVGTGLPGQNTAVHRMIANNRFHGEDPDAIEEMLDSWRSA